MRSAYLIPALLVLLAAPPAARADPKWSCHKDSDCRFAYDSPCSCPPCGVAPRPVETRTMYKLRADNWARKVRECQPCQVCDPPTVWRGTRAVCRQGKCTVTGLKPRPLKRWQQANLGGLVYTVPVSWQQGQLRPLSRGLRAEGVRFEWHGLPRGFAAKEGEAFTFEVVLTDRLRQRQPGSKKIRTTFQGQVLVVQPVGK